MSMFNRRHLIAALLATAVSGISGQALSDGHLSPAHDKSYLYIGWPNDGEVIKTRSFRMWFGLRNMGLAPAGNKISFTGHHHLLINTEIPPLDEEIPADKNHLHFGAGQSEAVIELPPGKHTLQLLLGDHNHVPHDPPIMSKKITVTVK